MKLPRARILLAAGSFAIAAGAVAFVSYPTLSLPQAFALAGSEPISSTDRADAKSPILLAQAANVPSPGLPGGASSLQETFQDWQVNCSTHDAGKRCVLAQQQADAKTRQRVLAIELTATAPGKVTGALVLPFGLALDAGVSIRVDEGTSTDGLRFRTCFPAGCIVPLEMSETLIAAMRDGDSLLLTATPSDDDQPVSFSVSLKGFSTALDRTLQLGQ